MGQAVDQDDEIELLTLLIEDWDRLQYQLKDLDPIFLVKELMAEHNMKATILAELLEITPSALSNILNYRRRFSASHIRTLSVHFRIDQSFFNKVYPLEYPKPAVKVAHVAENQAALARPAIRTKRPISHLDKMMSTKSSPAKKASTPQSKKAGFARKTK